MKTILSEVQLLWQRFLSTGLECNLVPSDITRSSSLHKLLAFKGHCPYILTLSLLHHGLDTVICRTQDQTTHVFSIALFLALFRIDNQLCLFLTTFFLLCANNVQHKKGKKAQDLSWHRQSPSTFSLTANVPPTECICCLELCHFEKEGDICGELGSRARKERKDRLLWILREKEEVQEEHTRKGHLSMRYSGLLLQQLCTHSQRTNVRIQTQDLMAGLGGLFFRVCFQISWCLFACSHHLLGSFDLVVCSSDDSCIPATEVEFKIAFVRIH